MIPLGILFRVSTAYNRSNFHLDLRTVGEETRFNWRPRNRCCFVRLHRLIFTLEAATWVGDSIDLRQQTFTQAGASSQTRVADSLNSRMVQMY
jgi:hypothetical protein